MRIKKFTLFTLALLMMSVVAYAQKPAPQKVVMEKSEYTYSFIQSMNGWTTIDADGDGNDWYLLKNSNSLGYDGKQGLMTSASYSYDALTPDNYLVSPKMKLDGSITFWASAQDAAWPTEHFSVAVSVAGNTSAADFTDINEWDMTAARQLAPRRAQGNWYEYTIDLSSYEGAEGYVAIRHFNCSDWFRLNVDDITLVTSELLDDYDPDLELEPVDPRITPPEGLETEEWTFAAYFFDGDETSTEKTIKIGFDGNDVYVQGIGYYQPEAWIKGTLSDDGKTITFASGQYYGAYLDAYDMWFAAYDMVKQELVPITVDYDAEAGIITWPESSVIVENAAEDEYYPYGYYLDALTIRGTAPAFNEIPDGLQTDEWMLKSQTFVQDEETGEQVTEEYDYRVQVGFVDNDIYIMGLFESQPNAVVKGTLDPETNKVTFAGGQCIGETYTIDWNTWSVVYIPIYLTGYGEDGFEDIMMTYDPEAQTLTMDSEYMIVNGAWLLFDPYQIQTDVVLSAIPDVAATPAQPEITSSSLTGFYPSVRINVPVSDEEGNPILTSKLYYRFYYEVGHEQYPITLSPSEYTELEEEMTEIPYLFSDNWDIYNYLFYLNMDFSTWNKFGIQSVYYGGDEKNASQIFWYTFIPYLNELMEMMREDVALAQMLFRGFGDALDEEDAKEMFNTIGAANNMLKAYDDGEEIDEDEARALYKKLKEFIDMFDDITTGVANINANVNLNESWFDLNGHRIQGQPTQKGVYILNGKKVVIK